MDRTDEIVIDVVTMDWSYGWYGNFDVLISQGSKLVVEWGDGKSERYTGKAQEWVRLSHEYPIWNYQDRIPYRISIFTEEGQILGISEALTEFQVERINLRDCPSLRMFSFRYLNELDLNNNPNLRVLECDNFMAERLDLSGNRLLEQMSCKFSSNLKELGLVNCNKLRGLDCWGCRSLLHIRLSNQSLLTEVCITDCANLTTKSMGFLRQIVAGNVGTVFESEDDSWRLDNYFPCGAAWVPDKKR